MSRLFSTIIGTLAAVTLLALPAAASGESGEPVAAPDDALSPLHKKDPPKPDHAHTPADHDCGWRCVFPTGEEYPDGGYDSLAAFIEGELERLGKMNLYGVTSQLPQGYMSFKWDWSTITASQRYDRNGNLGPVMAPIEFTDDNGKKLIAIDMGLTGTGGGHTIQVSYGILDELDWYIEFPFTYMDVRIDPVVEEIDEEGNRIDPSIAGLVDVADPKAYNAGEFLYSTLPKLGRPTPATRYKASWLLGDINTGFSWNLHRNATYSAALTARVALPTGHTPHPNQNLTYGTGPALETGGGGWGTSMTMGYDWKLFDYHPWHIAAVASTEVTLGYGFEQDRPYPTNFVKPSPLAQGLDPVAFPDLSNLTGTFKYTPGFNVDWSVQLNLQLAIVGLGVAFGSQYSQEPLLSGDPGFVSMAKGLELLGDQQATLMQLGGSLSLLPLYIPGSLAVSWKKALSGSNAIVFDDYWQVVFQGYIPLLALWK